ncbi:MAG: inositol monophosphatase [Candidatus Omnitrophota bacterium]
MSDILQVSIDAAQRAGKYLFDNFGNISTIESKGDRNLATNIDKEAERIIVDKIKSAFPTHGILAEEGSNSQLESEYVWVIDPLDGTHNFIRGINIFGVSIGVVRNNVFIAGVIYMPVTDELYVAERGGGAYKNDKKIKVSSARNLKECSISFDSSIRYAPSVMLKALGELAGSVFNIRMFGSSVRALSYIAEGTLDFSVEYFDHPWDFSGGVCIIEEAGGMLTTLRGESLSYRDIGYIASNGHMHEEVGSLIKACF